MEANGTLTAAEADIQREEIEAELDVLEAELAEAAGGDESIQGEICQTGNANLSVVLVLTMIYHAVNFIVCALALCGLETKLLSSSKIVAFFFLFEFVMLAII